jgi:hypothetical protein
MLKMETGVEWRHVPKVVGCIGKVLDVGWQFCKILFEIIVTPRSHFPKPPRSVLPALCSANAFAPIAARSAFECGVWSCSSHASCTDGTDEGDFFVDALRFATGVDACLVSVVMIFFRKREQFFRSNKL